MSKYVGYNLVSCLNDLLSGKVKVDQVVAIHSATLYGGLENKYLQETIDFICQRWPLKDQQDKVEKIIWDLILSGRINPYPEFTRADHHFDSVWITPETKPIHP